MLVIDSSKIFFKKREIWFANKPFNVNGFHNVLFFGCKEKKDLTNFQRNNFTTLIIDLTQDLEEIWRKMSKSSCRYAIKRAIRDGVKIEINQNYLDFIDINESFRDKKGLISYSKDVEFMKNNGTLFVSKYKGEILGGQFYLNDEKNSRWLLGASKRLNASGKKATLIGNTNRLMVWEAIKHFKDKGLIEFDMGGYYLRNEKNEEKERINFFKKSFGGELVTKYNYTKYNVLYKSASKIICYFLNR